MKTTKQMIGVFLLLATELLVVGENETSTLIRELLARKPADRDVPAVSESTRVTMIGELLRAKTNDSVRLEFGASRIGVLLMDLGDRETMTDYIGRLRRQKDGFADNAVLEELRLTRHPDLLPMLSTNLFLEEPAEARMDIDYQVWPVSVAAASVFCSVLARSSEFDPSIRRWMEAERSQRPGLHSQRELIRVFWRENSQHFIAKNYQAVRPPSGVSPVAQVKATTNAAVAAPMVPAAARPPAKRAKAAAVTNLTAAPQAASALAPTAAPVPAANTAPFWPLLLLAGASLGGWLWWRAR
jgi:hypothetical protein